MLGMFSAIPLVCLAASTPSLPSSARLAPASDELAFVRNQGQFDSRAEFLLRRSDCNIWITRTGAIYDYYHTVESPALFTSGPDERKQTNVSRLGQAVEVSVEGAVGSGQAQGVEVLPGIENYFVGDKSTWAAGVSRYREATISNVKSGVSMRFYTEAGASRYDLILKAGVEPNSVQLRYRGVNGLSVSPTGNLQYETRFGIVTEQGLTVYQKKDGILRTIPSKFQLAKNGLVGFKIGAHDPTLPITIDPRVIVRSSYVGGASTDSAQDVAVSPTGKVYVSGLTASDSASFPVSAGAYEHNFQGGLRDWFVSCMNSDLSQLLYRTYLGTSSDENLSQIELTAGGNIVFCGQTPGAGLPVSTDAYKSVPQANDAYVCRISAELGTIIGATYYGGPGSEGVWDMKVLPSGSIAVCGTAGANLPTKGSWAKTVKTGASDAFLAILSGDFKSLNMCTYFGGIFGETARSLAVGANGAVFLVGNTNSPDLVSTYGFDAPGLSWDSTLGGARDGFIARIESKSGRVEGVSFIGSDTGDTEEAECVEVTPSNNVLVGARMSGEYWTSANAYSPTLSGTSDGYVALFNAGLKGVVCATFLGGSFGENLEVMALTSTGSVIVAGWTDSDSSATKPFPVVGGGSASPFVGRNVYVARLGSKLDQLISSITAGGSDGDEARGMCLFGRYENVYLVGDAGKDFPTTSNSFRPGFSGGSSDGFALIAAQSSDPVRIEFASNPTVKGTTTWAKVVLNSPSRPGGQYVTIKSAIPGVSLIPSQVYIPAGIEAASFKVRVDVSTIGSSAAIDATGSGSTVTNILQF